MKGWLRVVALGLSLEAVRKLCLTGQLPAQMYGSTIRIKREELDKFITTSHTKTSDEPSSEFVRLEYARKMLGLSREAVRKLCLTGKLPAQIYGTTIRIKREALDKFIATSHAKPSQGEEKHSEPSEGEQKPTMPTESGKKGVWKEPPGDFVRPVQACKLLGLSLEAVRKLCMSGKLPAQMYGPTIRIKREDLNKFIEASRTNPSNGGKTNLGT